MTEGQRNEKLGLSANIKNFKIKNEIKDLPTSVVVDETKYEINFRYD